MSDLEQVPPRVDRLGRPRRDGQERGLRPLHPELPERWISKALRVAMERGDWERLEALARVLGADAPTQARAYGIALSRLIRDSRTAETVAWMDWEQQKAARLLRLAV